MSSSPPTGDLTNLQRARSYIAAIESGSHWDEIAPFFDPEVMQEEFPNRLLPQGTRRNLAQICEAADRGRRILSRQRYVVRSAISAGDLVVLEVTWTGVMAAPFASLAVGDEMRAHFAVVLEFRNGKIIAQRNYDCFDPF